MPLSLSKQLKLSWSSKSRTLPSPSALSPSHLFALFHSFSQLLPVETLGSLTESNSLFVFSCLLRTLAAPRPHCLPSIGNPKFWTFELLTFSRPFLAPIGFIPETLNYLPACPLLAAFCRYHFNNSVRHALCTVDLCLGPSVFIFVIFYKIDKSLPRL